MSQNILGEGRGARCIIESHYIAARKLEKIDLYISNDWQCSV